MAIKTFSFDEAFKPEASLDSTAKTFSYEDALIPVQKETPPVEALAAPKTFSFEEASKPVAAKPAEDYSTLDFLSDTAKKAGASLVSSLSAAPLGLESAVRNLPRNIKDIEGTSPPELLFKGIKQLAKKELSFVTGEPYSFKKELISGIKNKEEEKKVIDQFVSSIPHVPGLQGVANYGQELGQDIRDTVSAQGQKASSDSQITGNLAKAIINNNYSNISFGKDPSLAGYALNTSEVLGSLGPVIATALLTRSPSATAVVGGSMGAGEGVTSAQQYIGAMTDAELTKSSPYYASMVKQGVDPVQARKVVTDKAAEYAAQLQGSVATFGSQFTGKLLTGAFDKVLNKAVKNRLGKIAVGGAIGAAEEGSQEFIEGIASDMGINTAVVREVGTDSFANFVMGALGGIGPGAYSGYKAKTETETLKTAKEVTPPKTAGQTDEEIQQSRDAYIKSLKEEMRSKAETIRDTQALAETEVAEPTVAEPTVAEPTVAEPTVAEVSSTPGVLNEDTLTSLGLNKRSNAFKELLGVDLNTNEGLAFFDETLDNHTGKINETAVSDYLRSIAPTIDAQVETTQTPEETAVEAVQAPEETAVEAVQTPEAAAVEEVQTPEVAAIEEVQAPEVTQATDIASLPIGNTINIGGITYQKTDTGFGVVRPETTQTPEAAAVEEVQTPEAITAEAPQGVDPTTQIKNLSNRLRSLDPTNPLIEDLLAFDVNEDTIAEANDAVAQLVQERQAKGQTQPSELRELSEEQAIAETTPVEQVAELEIDPDKYIDNTKAELGDVIRRVFPVTENIVPEERSSIGDLIKAITNLMHAFIRKGVKSMGQAIKQARSAMGQYANRVTPAQYRQSYTEAAERPSSPIASESAGDKKAKKQAVEKLQKKSGIKKPSNNAGKSLFKSVMEADLNHAIDNLSSAVLSSDNGLNNQMRTALEKAGMPWPDIQKILEGLMTSQATHSQNVAAMFLEMGSITYDEAANMFQVTENPNGSYGAMMETIGELAKKYKISEDAMNLAAHTYFVSNRSRGLIKTNERLKKRALAKELEGKGQEADKLIDKVVLVNMTAAEIKAGLDIRKEIPEIGKIVEQFNVVRLEVINHLENTGLYSQEEAAEIADTFDYVPFYREAQIEANEGPKENTRGLLDRTREKHIKGSYNPVNNVFNNINRWVTYSIARGINNSQGLYAVNAMQQNMVGSISPDPLPPTTKVPPGNLVAVWDNGVEKRYRVEDPMFVHYFTGARAAYAPLINTFAVTGFNKLFRANIILDPLFSAKQVIMDGLGAMFTSGVKHFYMIPIRAIKEFVLTIPNWSKTHKTLRGYGAAGETDFASVSRRISEEIKRGEARDYNTVEKIANTLLKPLRWITTASDNAIRQAVYEQEMAESGNQSTAIRKAFEIINFRRSGYSSRVNTLRQSVTFTGAYLQVINVQSKIATGKGITPTQKKQTYVRLLNSLAGYGLFAFLNLMAVGDDDEYQETDQTIRDLRMFIPGLTEKYGVWVPVRADPFMLIAKMLPEHIYNLYREEGGEDWTKFKKAFKAYMAAAMLGPTPMPQLPKTVLETMMNRSMNTGRDIVGQGIEGRETERQFTSTTSEFSKMLGRSGLVSPVIADYFINNIGASVGRAFILLTNSLLKDSEAPEKSTRDTLASVAPAFIKREGGTRAKNDLYELRDIVDEAYTTYKDIEKYGSEAEYNKKYNESIEKIMQKPSIDVAIRQLAQIRADERMIHERPPGDMDKAQKERMLKALRDAEETILFDIQYRRDLSGLDKDNPFRKSK